MLKRIKNVRTLAGRALVKFLKRDDGPTAVEYAVMLALVIVIAIAGITALGKNANSTFSYVGGTVAPPSTSTSGS